MTSIDLLGWLASLCLLATVGAQVARQRRSGDVVGVSMWLYVGQITASAAFVAYSALIGSTVFIVTNVATGLAAVAGLWFFLRSSRARRDEEAFDDQRDTLPIPGALVALAAVATEPVSPAVLTEEVRDVMFHGGTPLELDGAQLVVSPRDTIGSDPIHRHPE